MNHRTPSAPRVLTLLALLVGVLAAGAGAYTVYLKDGSRVVATDPPVIEDGQAIITLPRGTRTSIAASEIDFERTREANRDTLGDAMVLDEGGFTDLDTEDVAPRQDRMSDAARHPGLGARPQSRRQTTVAAGDALENWQRVPYRGNLDVATEILAVFRGQGIEQVGIYQGTTGTRLLIELATNSESAVFRSLKIAAGALSRVNGLYPQDVDAFELVMTTSQRERAGQFLITPGDAAEILAEGTEISSYFVSNVRF